MISTGERLFARVLYHTPTVLRPYTLAAFQQDLFSSHCCASLTRTVTAKGDEAHSTGACLQNNRERSEEESRGSEGCPAYYYGLHWKKWRWNARYAGWVPSCVSVLFVQLQSPPATVGWAGKVKTPKASGIGEGKRD